MKGKLKYAKPISDDVTLLAGCVVDIIGSSETEYLCKSIDGYEFPVSKFEIHIIDNTPIIDWEQRRYEIARDCLASSFCEEAKRIEREFDSHNYDGPRCKKEEDFIDEHASKIVRYAIRFADELIKKLKGE